VLITDTTECPISKPKNAVHQRLLYSGYKKQCTLKYEVAIDAKSGVPIYWSGPFTGATADITVFRSGLKGVMERNHLVGIADGTYQGEHSLLLVPPRPFISLTPLERELHLLLSRKRVLIENLYARLKAFQSLSIRFRNDLLLHRLVFFFVLSVITIDLKYRPLRK